MGKKAILCTAAGMATDLKDRIVSAIRQCLEVFRYVNVAAHESNPIRQVLSLDIFSTTTMSVPNHDLSGSAV